jgi:hypothetical protein
MERSKRGSKFILLIYQAPGFVPEGEHDDALGLFETQSAADDDALNETQWEA